jgi:hypothetical protein
MGNRTTLDFIGILAIGGALLACGSGPTWTGKRVTHGDPKGDLVSVSCKGGSHLCYEVAGRYCPGGFTVTERSTPRKDHWPTSMLVRCTPRAAPAPVATAARACRHAGGACSAEADCCDGLTCLQGGGAQALCATE